MANQVFKNLSFNLSTPSGDGGEDSWSEISGGVDGVAAVESEADANVQHNEADIKRNQRWFDLQK